MRDRLRQPLQRPATQGPTFPPKVAPTTTSPWHMLIHETSAKGVPAIDAKFHRIVIPGDAGAQHNPTVYVLDGKLHVIVRVLRGTETTNYMAQVRPQWVQGREGRVEQWTLNHQRALACTASYNGPLGQLEDLRIFYWHKSLWAIAAAHDGRATAIRQALLKLEDAALTQLHTQTSIRHEKNWMPCVDEDRLRLVYSIDPLVVLDVVESHGHITTMPLAQEVPQATGHIRGGSQLIHWNDGWIAIVHHVHRPPRTSKMHNPLLSDFRPPLDLSEPPVVYIHRFARFSKDLKQVRLGSPFYFNTVGIEFCCGLVRHEGRLVASFGVADKEAWLCEIEHATVGKMLGEMYTGDEHAAAAELPAAASVLLEALTAAAAPEPLRTAGGAMVPHQCACGICGRTIPVK